MTNYREILRLHSLGLNEDRDRVKLPVRSEHCGSNPATGSKLRPAMATAGGNVG